MIHTNAATFLETLEAERMKDVPYFRDYIPAADPIAARAETEKKYYAYRSEETKKMIESVKIGEEIRMIDILTRCPDVPKNIIRHRLAKSGYFVRVSRGLYRRCK